MAAQLLTVADVARILGVGVRTAYELAETADPALRLPAVRIGRRLRFHPDDVARYVDDHREASKHD